MQRYVIIQIVLFIILLVIILALLSVNQPNVLPQTAILIENTTVVVP